MDLTSLTASGMDSVDAAGLLINIMWTMIGAFLVYFMQAGFAMCEAGFTRAKNTGNILMKNMMDFVLGKPVLFPVRICRHARNRLERDHRYKRISDAFRSGGCRTDYSTGSRSASS